MKIGLVGLGKIARDQHLPAIAATDGAELIAIASRNATLRGVRSYLSLQDMLAAEPALDAIILCQPPEARFTAAQMAIAAGKHVFLEKPPGATVSEVETLIDLAKQHQVTLFASWHSRFGAAVPKAKHWLAAHLITSINILWKEDIRKWHHGQDWILQAGGFGVFDPGINALSILTEIVCEPIRLIDAILHVPNNRAAPIAAELDMRTGSGVPISVAFDFLQTGTQLWDINIAAGGNQLLLSDGGNQLTINGSAQKCSPEDEYPSMYQHFVDLVAASKSDVDMAPLQLVADAFLRGRMVTTDSFDF
jgi:D-galactose 1-dehydrogenase